MTLTPAQTLITIGMVTVGTMITRFLPFAIFKNANSSSSYISYLGQVLPYSAIGLLLVYCLKGVDISTPAHGLPEAITVIFIAAFHYFKENALLSIGAGTVLYMVLVQAVFI